MNNVNYSDASVKIWDLPVRLFHWALAIGFAAAYLSAKAHVGELHVLIGYALCVLLAARVYWGFFGTHFARFSSFTFSPRDTMDYIRSMFRGEPQHHYGHNPAGALYVFGVMALLALIFTTGLVTLAVIDFEGPLLFLIDYVDDDTSYAFRHLHELLTNVGLALVAMHLIGVAVGSIQHKENLVRAMVTGKKKPAPHEPNEQSKTKE